MKQIKTILGRLNYANVFDEDVNEALKEVWTLKHRALFRGAYGGQYSVLYAELEKEVSDDEL